MLSDSLYLAAQLVKLAIFCAAVYAAAWFMLTL